MNIAGDGENPTREAAREPTRRPGHELGAAREREGISLEDMAARLNLTRGSVEAIERDDYEHLPPAAFVRGYLRAYAREVGMDGNELVAEFDALCGEDTDPELELSEGVPDPASGRGPVLAVVILVAVVVIGGGAWWIQQEPATGPELDANGSGDDVSGSGAGTATQDEPADPEQGAAAGGGEPDTDTVPDSTATDTDAAAPAGDEPDAGASYATGGEAEAPTDVDTAETPGGQQVVDAAATEEVQPVDEAESADETQPVEEARSADETQPADEAQTGEEVAAVGEPEGPLATSSADLAATDAAATGPDRLEITVDGESWLEIYDSRGRRLAYTLYSGSAPVVLNGWAPFEVFLGNAPSVTVRVGDRVIDPTPFVRSDNTARFLADSEGASQR